MDEKEKKVYEHLLDALKETTDPDTAFTLAAALDRFCDAIVSMKLHVGSER